MQGHFTPGVYRHQLRTTHAGLARGVYVLKLETETGNLTRKVVLQ